MTRTLRLTLVLALAAALLSGCGEKTERGAGGGERPLERLELVLDYFPNADHAGIYLARARGLFARAGLDVQIRVPSDPAAPLKLLQAGRADVVISYEPELLLARDQGAQLVSVAALAQKPLTSIIALDSRRIRRPADLAGKRVGTAGIPYQAAYLRAVLERAGVDPGSVDVVDVGFNLTPAMLSKRVDATLGSFWNYEGVDLRRRGKRPTIIRMDEAGVPTYDELVLVARRADLGGAQANRLRRFLRALALGHDALRRDPKAGVDALLDAARNLDRGLQSAVVRATLPVFFPEDRERPWGWQDPAEWHAYGEWMHARGLVKRPPRAARALTNEFLPGEGLDPEPAGLK